MKNRTVIGIICMALAVAVAFLVSPAVSKMKQDTAEVPRLNRDIRQGTQITEEMLETVSVKRDSLPADVIRDSTLITGRYAASALYSGDCLTENKLCDVSNAASDVFASLDGTKVAISFTIDSFAAGLSGKLRNGDIISLIVMDKDTGKVTVPEEFNYVRVITTTTAGGVEQDGVIVNDDGTYDVPATVTVLANTVQAKLLTGYEDGYTVQAALVFRGDSAAADRFIAVQDEYFENLAEEESMEKDEGSVPDEETEKLTEETDMSGEEFENE